MSDAVRLGLVGAGVAAQAIHVPALARRPDLFRVTAVCDLSRAARDAVAARCGVGSRDRYGSAAELIEKASVDALLVLSSGSHGAVCSLAAEAGLPVFTEKPLAYTLAEADALEPAAARLAVGYMKIYDPAVRRAAELLAGRAPRSVEVVVLHPPAAQQLAHLCLLRADDVEPKQAAELEAEEQRLLQQALGPAPPEVRDLYRWKLLGSVVHDLAVVRALVGAPVRWARVDVWSDSVSLDGLLPGGGRLSIRWHYLDGYPVYREEVAVHDERGSLRVAFPSPYLLSPGGTLTVVDADGPSRAREARVTSATSPFEEELVAFHRLVTAGEPTLAGLAEGRADIALCQQALRLYCEEQGLPVGGEAVARAHAWVPA